VVGMGRDVKLVVRLAENVRDEFQKLADAHGVTMSALAAYLIGQHVYQQKRVLEPLIEALTKEARIALSAEVPSEAALDTEGAKSLGS
jgi:CopG-like RHH_1 or ribbon-helix-helix domain, RHH_5